MITTTEYSLPTVLSWSTHLTLSAKDCKRIREAVVHSKPVNGRVQNWHMTNYKITQVNLFVFRGKAVNRKEQCLEGSAWSAGITLPDVLVNGSLL